MQVRRDGGEIDTPTAALGLVARCANLLWSLDYWWCLISLLQREEDPTPSSMTAPVRGRLAGKQCLHNRVSGTEVVCVPGGAAERLF